MRLLQLHSGSLIMLRRMAHKHWYSTTYPLFFIFIANFYYSWLLLYNISLVLAVAKSCGKFKYYNFFIIFHEKKSF
jgi:hypothetical protein